jgi:hypothetical protein
MVMRLHELKLIEPSGIITSERKSYRPPSWPPPDNWVTSENQDGSIISRYVDPLWDFSELAGKTLKFRFQTKAKRKNIATLHAENQSLLRLWTTWIIWNPACGNSWITRKSRFNLLKRLVVLCDDNNILASELYRFPKIIEKIPGLYKTSFERDSLISLLDRIHRDVKFLGCDLLDVPSLEMLAKAFLECPTEETKQTAYIPPRIWKYQLSRLRECIDDYLINQEKIDKLFNFCLNAYERNFGSLEKSILMVGSERSKFLPFGGENGERESARTGCRFYGSFRKIAKEFGVSELFEKWIVDSGDEDYDVKVFSKYLTLVDFAGCAYIINYTLQRKQEGGSLRADCLIWENDEKLGRIPIICGETTKTIQDSDARWPTSPSVEVGVLASTSVARLRMRCAEANPLVACTPDDIKNPYLHHYAFEPWATGPENWGAYSKRPTLQTYANMMVRFNKLFDTEVLRITEDDLTISLMLTPNLDSNGKFKVGEIWPLAFHQLRRTTAVNMFASGLVSDTSMQVILKHLYLAQSEYYGRNFHRLKFNDDVGSIISLAKYEVLARNIMNLVTERYFSPVSEQRKAEIVVNIINSRDFRTLFKSAKKGEVSIRETRLGACTKREPCPYEGIESSARCAGGDGRGPCDAALFDRNKRDSVARQLVETERQIVESKENSPRRRFLLAEARGLRNYVTAIEKSER